MLAKLLKRDLKIFLGKKNEFLTLMFFFILVISLFPLATGKEKLSAGNSIGIIWITALLYSLLSIRLYFEEDYYDGSLEGLIVRVHLHSLMVLSKSLAHLIFCFLPLLPVVLAAATLLNIPGNQFHLLAALAVGLLCISFINALSSALTLGLRNASAVSSIVILPLHIPVLIFGIGASQAEDTAMFIKNLSGLGALALLLIPISMAGSALAIRAAAED